MSELQTQRIKRILEKLEQVRQKGLTCFGADSHRFRLHPPIDEAALSHFEEEHHINLPNDYRSFLKLAGNGGAGPYYGIYKLDEWKDFIDWTSDEVPTDILALPCPLHPQMSREADWESQFRNCVSPYQGMISIGSQGCTYAMGLIVTGEYASRVVYLDADGQSPYVVREPDFLSWYERWLDELLGGNDMLCFGYGVGGDESHLLQLLRDNLTSDEDRVEATNAVGRLPHISQHAQVVICDLLRHHVPGVRAGACAAVEKFAVADAKAIIPTLLNDESSMVRKVAIRVCDKLLGAVCDDKILELLQTDEPEVAKTAIFVLKERDGIPRDILLKTVQTSPHCEIRSLAAWAISWEPKDGPVMLSLLHDADQQVRSYAVLGLRQNRLGSSLDAVIDLLDHETDCNTVESILRMLGEVNGKRNADVLLAWTQRGDDFQRLSAIDSLCKLGDVRVEPVARSLLREGRSPVRRDKNGISSMSHQKPICDFVSESLCSSPNQKLRRVVSKNAWPTFLRFWK